MRQVFSPLGNEESMALAMAVAARTPDLTTPECAGSRISKCLQRVDVGDSSWMPLGALVSYNRPWVLLSAPSRSAGSRLKFSGPPPTRETHTDFQPPSFGPAELSRAFGE